MDLTQQKLTKSEWDFLEVPVNQNEKKILKLIYNLRSMCKPSFLVVNCSHQGKLYISLPWFFTWFLQNCTVIELEY